MTRSEWSCVLSVTALVRIPGSTRHSKPGIAISWSEHSDKVNCLPTASACWLAKSVAPSRSGAVAPADRVTIYIYAECSYSRARGETPSCATVIISLACVGTIVSPGRRLDAGLAGLSRRSP